MKCRDSNGIMRMSAGGRTSGKDWCYDLHNGRYTWAVRAHRGILLAIWDKP